MYLLMYLLTDQIRLTRIPGGLVLLWFCAWTPYAVVALLGITGHRSMLTPLAVVVPGLACKLAACVDPYVYALSHPRCKQNLSAGGIKETPARPAPRAVLLVVAAERASEDRRVRECLHPPVLAALLLLPLDRIHLITSVHLTIESEMPN
ncbi:hypothetical protein HAZT_HAZT008742 [Hyalella azteca]|uniref:G-protein coupled receptors family 1 profile domain-containing protein n=1 Tax=Hyalella azteca TaxID=294128 RepID=A0A6A0H229_HYAAZ|nr:hypothetical protein HAZT_HAZT008742 [Hyalella azteca]